MSWSLWNADATSKAELIYELTTSGSVTTSFASPSSGPRGLGVDQNGCLWNADWGATKIYKLTQSGSVLKSFASPSSGPGGIGVDQNGCLWNADYNATKIYKFTQSGSEIKSFASPSSSPMGLGVESTFATQEQAGSVHKTNDQGVVQTKTGVAQTI